jgi:autotransporter-associated beta strand protein
MWNVNGNGDWSTGGNWSPSSPNGTDFQAYFGSIASGPIAVNVDAPKTVSRIHFNSTSSYTLSGSAITLDSSSGQAAINDLRGSHTIASPVVMNQDTTMHAAGLTDTLTISGNISGASGKGITKTGSGVLVLSGTNSYTGTTTVSSGKLLLNGTHTGGGAYSVASQATIGGTGVTDSAVNVAAGGIVAPGASVGVLTVGSLSLSTSRLSYEIDGTGTDRVNVTNSGGLTLAGVSTFTIANLGGMAAGTYTLIDYAGTALASLSNFNLSATTLGGFSISLVNNQANTSIDLSVIPQTITASWNVNADGNWSLGTNWTGGTAPNGVDHSATFGSVITAAHVVTVDAPQTVGTVIFDNTTAGYTIAGTSTLTLDVSTGQAAITVNNGSHVISAPIVLNDNTTITSATGTGVAITGNVTGTGRTITKAGAGTVQFENVRASNLSVSAGSAKISTKGTANSAAGTSVVQSLSISTGANLDLANNSMIVDYTGAVGTQVTDIRGHLSSGRMTTSSGTATTRLGYGDNAVLNKSTFAGQSVDTSSILVKYTYAGDADLDGDADGVDIGTWATNFTGELGGTGSMVWTQGDWDYDGDVDGVDAGLWAQAFTGELGGAGLGSLVVDDPNIAPGAAAILRGMGITVVPEPSTIGLLAGLGAMALNRRNRRRK